MYKFRTLVVDAEAMLPVLEHLNEAPGPLFKIGEWLLVVLLALHAVGGIRLLLIEFAPWSGPRKDLIAVALACGLGMGLAFLLALL